MAAKILQSDARFVKHLNGFLAILSVGLLVESLLGITNLQPEGSGPFGMAAFFTFLASILLLGYSKILEDRALQETDRLFLMIRFNCSSKFAGGMDLQEVEDVRQEAHENVERARWMSLWVVLPAIFLGLLFVTVHSAIVMPQLRTFFSFSQSDTDFSLVDGWIVLMMLLVGLSIVTKMVVRDSYSATTVKGLVMFTL